MQGSGGNNAGGGGGPQRPFGRYAELNQAHARVAKERTDRSVVQLEKADRTHPAEPRGSAPAVATGNGWVERARSMVEQFHGRLFGRYPSVAPSPAGTETSVTVASVARSTSPEPAAAEKTSASAAASPGRIAVETNSLQEIARRSTVWARLPETTERSPERQSDIKHSATAGVPSAAVNHVYDHVASATALREQVSAFKQAEWETGSRPTTSTGREAAATQQTKSPTKSPQRKEAAVEDTLGADPAD